MKNVTVGVVPRERFSHAVAGLRSILENTDAPFNLVVINNEIPKVYWNQMERMLSEVTSAKVIHTEQFITSNAARNLVTKESGDDYICFIENDISVAPGWLRHLVDACEKHDADVVTPLLLEPYGDSTLVHFDMKLDHVERVESEGVVVGFRILQRRDSKEDDRTAHARRVEFVESHCLLFRKRVLDRINPFDERFDTLRDCVDISMTLWAAGLTVVMEPKSVVTFFPPPPIHPEDQDYFRFVWDLNKSYYEERAIREKWNLVDFPTAIDFAEERLQMAEEANPEKQRNPVEEDRLASARAANDLCSHIETGQRVILVDDMEWGVRDFVPRFRVSPFLEKDGEYWGKPADDDMAIRELNRMRMDGVEFIAFGKPAFWWLDHYRGFDKYLRSNFKSVIENERVVAFDLRQQ